MEYRNRKLVFDEPTKNNIRRVAAILTSDVPKFGILFCGICGNGKTTMLYAFRNALNYLVNGGYFRQMYPDDKIGMYICDARELTQVISKNYEQFRSIRSRFMLGMEDIGREPTEVLDFGNVLNPVIDLLEYRYDNQLFTIITTNLTPKQLSEKYGERIRDRFNEMMEVVVFENETYRTQQ